MMNPLFANYLWNFKPSETMPVPEACIESNKKFFVHTRIVGPSDIEPLLLHYPALEKIWQRIPHWIIQADLARLLHVYFHGGFYFDVDCRIEKKIPLDDRYHMILFTETVLKNVNKLGPRECKNPENALRVANYAFGSTLTEHPFLNEVILECIKRLEFLLETPSTPLSQTDILWVCGPDVITSVYHKSRNAYSDLVLLDKSYLAHLCHGSWRE